MTTFTMIDTKALRGLIGQAHLTGKDVLVFPIQDVKELVDELDLGRAATAEAGRILEEARQVILKLTDPKLLDAEKKRLVKDDVAQLLVRMGQMLDADPLVDLGEALAPPKPKLELVRAPLPKEPIQ